MLFDSEKDEIKVLNKPLSIKLLILILIKMMKQKGERRGSNPRIMESQPIAVTTWLRPPLRTHSTVFSEEYERSDVKIRSSKTSLYSCSCISCLFESCIKLSLNSITAVFKV